MTSLKNLTVQQRIIGSFGVILLLMSMMAIGSGTQLALIAGEVSKLKQHSLPGLFLSTRLLEDLDSDYTLLRRHIRQHDPVRMNSLRTEVRSTDSEIDRLTTSYVDTISSAREREKFEAFRTAFASYDFESASLLVLSSERKTKAAAIVALTQRIDPRFAVARAALEVLVDHNKETAQRSAEDIGAAVRAAIFEIIIVFAIALTIAFLCGYLLLRDITNRLRNVAGIANQIAAGDLAVHSAAGASNDEIGMMAVAFDRMVASLKTAARAAGSIAAGDLSIAISVQSPKDVMGNALTSMVANLSSLIGQVQRSGIAINTSATEIAATSKQQQATATQTAATAIEINATSMEITATSRQLVKTMAEVSTVTEQTAALARSGQTSLLHMEDTMLNVMEAGGSITAKLAILNEKAANINHVVTTITRVADQTNLLSLNAAIEAEKAGDYGRGFSVVATEIRRLADQTAIATYDIEQMVKEILAAVSAGVMGMDKFSEAVRRGMLEVQQIGVQLTQIVQQVQALAPRVESVNEGMQAQATGAEQITEALTHLTEAAQQTAESLQLSSAAVDELNRVSNGLRSGISTFQLQA